ncbi:hypothetical protein [Photobacterium swingsii]|uniref:hypothetical protein n=1 Tax=Photobacterium swingsii TaxID=680026 RepID=UPI0040686B13
MALKKLVELYRLGGCPELKGRNFDIRFEATCDIVEKLRTDFTPHRIEIIWPVSDPEDDLDVDDIEVGIEYCVQFRVGESNTSPWFCDVEELIERSPSLLVGEMPASFYLASSDVCYPDKTSLATKKLEQMCRFVSAMREIAPYHDKKPNSSAHSLVFVANVAESSKPLVLDISINKKVIDQCPTDISILEYLIKTESNVDHHFHEKLNVFSSTLLEFTKDIDSPKAAFEKLVIQWGCFVELYQANFATYLSGFAFHKAKKEVAQAEIELADKFANVTSDITNKVLAVPISMAAVIAMNSKSIGIGGDILVVIGLLITTYITVAAIDNQKSRLSLVNEAKKLVLGAFEGKKDSYPKELQTAITNMGRKLDSSSTKAKWYLRIFRVLTWAPVLSALAVFVKSHS